jgi:hypothetical protein
VLTCRLINYLIAAGKLWQQKQSLEVPAGTCHEVPERQGILYHTVTFDSLIMFNTPDTL